MIAVVGVGNSLRKDDGIGPRVVRSLKKDIARPGIAFFIAETVPENLIKKIKELGPEKVFIVDAVDFSGEPGDVTVMEGQGGKGFTHKMSYGLLSKLLGCEVRVLGIQPCDVGYGKGLSGKLRKRMPQIKAEIARLISG